MKAYEFNQCGVCINPDVVGKYKNPEHHFMDTYFEVHTAFFEGAWFYGYSYEDRPNQCGGGCGVTHFEHDERFNTQREAVLACCRKHLKYRGPEVDKCINELIRDNLQLTLF